MPKLLETFNQLIRSSEIRSSDRFPKKQLKTMINSSKLLKNISKLLKNSLSCRNIFKQIETADNFKL
jgi:hypothetical protein